MKSDRLKKLYEQSLSRPETSCKSFPLTHVLEKPLLFYPEEPKDFNFDYLEIGPGKGDFLIQLASEEKKILAIEISKKCFDRIKEKIRKLNLTSVTLIHGDARTALYHWIPDLSLEKCFVLFPDPWPKNKHRHRRLLQQDILTLISRKLKKCGELIFATDVKDYALQTFEHISTMESLQNMFEEKTMSTQWQDAPSTLYAQKWQNEGRLFFLLRYKKT